VLLPLQASEEQYGTYTMLAENKKGFSSGFQERIPVPVNTEDIIIVP